MTAAEGTTELTETAVPTETTAPTDPATGVQGDVNGSGDVDIRDVIAVIKFPFVRRNWTGMRRKARMRIRAARSMRTIR